MVIIWNHPTFLQKGQLSSVQPQNMLICYSLEKRTERIMNSIACNSKALDHVKNRARHDSILRMMAATIVFFFTKKQLCQYGIRQSGGVFSSWSTACWTMTHIVLADIWYCRKVKKELGDFGTFCYAMILLDSTTTTAFIHTVHAIQIRLVASSPSWWCRILPRSSKSVRRRRCLQLLDHNTSSH